MILGTVSSVVNGTGLQLTIDGESSPTSKQYMWLSPYRPFAGDRVLIADVGDQYVILGKVTTDIAASALAFNVRNRITKADSGYVTLGIKGGELYYGLSPTDGSGTTMYRLQKATS